MEHTAIPMAPPEGQPPVSDDGNAPSRATRWNRALLNVASETVEESLRLYRIPAQSTQEIRERLLARVVAELEKTQAGTDGASVSAVQELRERILQLVFREIQTLEGRFN